MTHVSVVEVEPRRAAVVRKNVAFAEMPDAQRVARAVLDAARVEAVGPSLTVWRPPSDGAIDYAPGVFVSDAFQPAGEVTLFMLPQGRAAHLRFEGGYEGLPTAWEQLFAACKRERWSPSGLNWEVYAQGGTAPVTDLFALLA